MLPVQMYSTTITDAETDDEVSIVTIPVRSLSERLVVDGVPSLPSIMDVLLRDTDFRPVSPRPVELSEERLPYLVDAVLRTARGDRDYREVEPGVPASAFATYVSYEASIPIEFSPLGPSTLIAAIGASGSVGGGIALAVLASANPLFFVTIPAGIILVGAAAVVGPGVGRKFLKKIGAD